MHFYQSVIHVYRPWMSRTSYKPLSAQALHPECARETCVNAAVSIAKLLVLYDRRYTFRRINIQGPAITCSAALLLIFADVSQYARLRGLNIAPYLGICFRALDEFGQCWESAKRAQDFLVNAQKQWRLKAKTRRNVRRRSDTLLTSPQGPRKRLSTTSGFDTTQPSDEPLWPRLDIAYPASDPTQIVPQDASRHLGSETQSDDGFNLHFDLDFEWVTHAGDQAVSGTWLPNSFTDIL